MYSNYDINGEPCVCIDEDDFRKIELFDFMADLLDKGCLQLVLAEENKKKKIKKFPKHSANEDDTLFITNAYTSGPVTVVSWSDGTITKVRCDNEDKYSEETGISLAINKKLMGKKNFHKFFNDYYEMRMVK